MSNGNNTYVYPIIHVTIVYSVHVSYFHSLYPMLFTVLKRATFLRYFFGKLSVKKHCHANLMYKVVLWIRIQIGSLFRNFVDPDPYSEYRSGSGSTQEKIIHFLEAKGVSSPFGDSTD